MRIGYVVSAALCAAVTAAAVMFAQSPQGRATAASAPTRTDAPDISGFWGLSFDSRKVPPAKLVPAITRAMLDQHARKDVHAIRWCNLLGTPAVMDTGSPLDIRQGTTAIIIAPEIGSAPRYL